ncbi:zinc-binding dehydrogenase [Gluconacetobacter azotocaptans]|nr:zinc-binding dehydrogenase [Gluconacetobacter azotocaptans]
MTAIETPGLYDAWAWDRPGSPMLLQRVTRPWRAPVAGEVVVANAVSAFNPVDWKMIATGHPAWQPGHVPGVDGVGRIAAVGAGVHLPIGMRVAYHQDLTRDGSFAAYTVLTADCVIPVPDDVTDDLAASVPCPGLTAWQAISKVPAPERNGEGQDVLVTGAGGAVALILTQFALRRNWRVWVTASRRHHDRLLALGVTGVFDYRATGWQRQLQETLAPRRLHAVFDAVSGDHARSLAPMIGYNGHLVCIQDRLDSPPCPPFTTALSLHEVALNAIHQQATHADWLELLRAGASLMGDVACGTLMLTPVHSVAFAELPTALSEFQAGRLHGKIAANILI